LRRAEMRIDVVTIFPDYLVPLELSLLGKARAEGIVTIETHDLRAWTDDRHHTVDDTPYGGGAGMVMKPEPWGRALDAVIAADPQPPLLIVPSPAGEPFTQAIAERLAGEPRLVFAAGRYEGIDQRVIDHFAGRVRVEEISVGDYVLNGGEVAVLAMIEAIARLLPGFMGNPESLNEESHHTGQEGGLLEYPVYTKPSTWRDLEVPPVLLSGDHGRIAAWRRQQSVRRTVERRPDLRAAATLVSADGLVPVLAVQADAPELWTLQRACWVAEAQVNETLDIPPLVESLDDVREAIRAWHTWVIRADGRLVASVRGRLVDTTWHVGRLMVAPDLQGRGIGRSLLGFIEAQAPERALTCELLTGARSVDNLRRYKKAGYRPAADGDAPLGVTRLVKRLRRG
jgi:tRNA (guanine37-N1)-methyltransferase